MSAATLRRAIPYKVAEREAATDPFGPDAPLTWWLVRLRYVDEPEAPRLTRFRECVRRLWYDRGKQPRVSEESRPVFPDLRGSYGSRQEARSWVRDSMDCLFAFPFGRAPFGEEIFQNPTFCRPYLNAEERRKDERDARAYTTTLPELICAALSEENRTLRRELAAIRDALDE